MSLAALLQEAGKEYVPSGQTRNQIDGYGLADGQDSWVTLRYAEGVFTGDVKLFGQGDPVDNVLASLGPPEEEWAHSDGSESYFYFRKRLWINTQGQQVRVIFGREEGRRSAYESWEMCGQTLDREQMFNHVSWWNK